MEVTREQVIWSRFLLRVSLDSLGRKAVLEEGRLQTNFLGSVAAHKKHFDDAVKDWEMASHPQGVAKIRCLSCEGTVDAESWYGDPQLGKAYCPLCQVPTDLTNILMLLMVRKAV